jgi:hypothetical protein
MLNHKKQFLRNRKLKKKEVPSITWRKTSSLQEDRKKTLSQVSKALQLFVAVSGDINIAHCKWDCKWVVELLLSM